MITPQVIITGSSQAVVESTPASTTAVEVTAPSNPVVVEVSVPGPQGPIGPTALPDATRIDASTIGVIYAGRAVNGSPETAAVWTVVKTTYSPAGIRLTRGTATGVTWTGRAGHTYV